MGDRGVTSPPKKNVAYLLAFLGLVALNWSPLAISENLNAKTGSKIAQDTSCASKMFSFFIGEILAVGKYYVLSNKLIGSIN